MASSTSASGTVAFCSQCGTKLDDGVRFCGSCGNSIGGSPAIAAPATTRYESIVLSVAPTLENDCINERESFGWNLQGRQEMIGHLREAETPDNLGRAVWRGFVEGATDSKTVEYDHYVKLHFKRSVGLRNLAKLKDLEAEYFSLPLPQGPGSLLWPILFTLMPIPGGFIGVIDPTGKQSPGISITIFAAFWMFLGILWIRSRRRKAREASEVRARSQARASEITGEAASLLN